jgi:DNA-binding transcriptional LysR family regulator
MCRAAGFEPDIVNEADSLALMIAGVSTGEGVALIPAHAEKLPHAGCVFVSLAPPVPVSDLLLVLPKEKPSTELAALTALLVDTAARGLGA